jgi:glycosyltransferase involved in cell wall biosynthesis
LASLRVGIISDRVEPFYRGGYEKRYFEIAQKFSEKHEVHIFTSCPKDNFHQGNIWFHNVAPLFEYFAKNSRSLTLDFAWSLGLREILRYDLDVIDCNFIPMLHVFPVMLMSKLKGTKLALTVHEFYSKKWWYDYFSVNIEKYKWPGFFAQTSYIATLASLGASEKLISVSKLTHDALNNNLGLSSSIVPNGINTSSFENKKTVSNGGAIKLLYTGRLVKEKGIDRILFAMAKLENSGFKIKLRVIGAGPDLERLKRLTNQLHLSEDVEFLGNIDDDAKVHVLAFSDIFVMPSSREGFSIASLEAMAAGLPIIAALPKHPESRGILELVKDGFNGFTYPSESNTDLAGKIELLIKNPDLREKLSENAVKSSCRYDWSKIIPRYEDVLYELANK